MGVRVERLPVAGGPAGAAWVEALRGGRPFEGLPALPRDDAGWLAASQAARGVALTLPGALVSALALRQIELGAGERAAANARRLGTPGALAVVTGQQPGLLGGPLLTFHKAAGAVHLARRVEALGGGPVVPVFWLASEDHDVDEANRLVLLDRDGAPRRLALDLTADGRSLMDLPVPGPAWTALFAAVSEVLPATDWGRAALDLVRPRPGDDLASACARALVRLLGDQGLVVVEPPVVSPFAGEALGRLLEDAEATRDAVAQAGAALRARGLVPPLDPEPGEAPLFVRDAPGGVRRRVTLTADGAVLRGRPGSEPRTRLAARLRAMPQLGSGDAIGRVFVQDRLLPVLAYLGGPTELLYHVQVKAAHDAVGLRYPLAVPRPEATWVDGKASRSAAAFGLSLAQVVADPALLACAEGLSDAAALRLQAALAAWAAAAGRLPDDLAVHAAASGPTAEALRRGVERLGREAAREAERVATASARDRGVGADRRRRLEDLVRPRGRPQERTLSPLSFVARYGPEALQEGLAGLDPLAEGHVLVHLEAPS